MIVLLGAILGAGTGVAIAWRRKGRPADILQYAFVYGLAFTLVALFLSIILYRTTVV